MNPVSAAEVERIIRHVSELAHAGGPAPEGSGYPTGKGIDSHPLYAYCQACAQANPAYYRELVGMNPTHVRRLPGVGTSLRNLAAYIDHTLLKPEATPQQIDALCAEAVAHGFVTVCVNACWVRRAADRLRGSNVKVCSVVGFPSGAHLPEIKGLETRRAIADGAAEIDTVINIGALKAGDDELVDQDLRAVTSACLEGGAISKIIIEAALLTDDEKIRACRMAVRTGAGFVKTSTGFGPGGATVHDVALMAGAVCGTNLGVKAAGGIRSYSDAVVMIRAGATRLGASAGIKILEESKLPPTTGHDH